MKNGILITIVLIVIIAGALVFVKSGKKVDTQATPTPTQSAQGLNIAPTQAAASDTTDTGLAKDSATVDSMLKSADQDSANIDVGLNDQQGNLSEQ